MWLLPQLPGQLVDEHAAAANWMLTTSAAYGIWGNPFLVLGLFDVLRSPLLYLLLALLLPTLAAQLADQLGAVRQMRSVRALDLRTPAQAANGVLAIADARPLFRYRGLVAGEVEPSAEALAAQLQREFSLVELAHAAPSPDLETDGSGGGTAVNLRGLSHPRYQALRALLPVGLLVAVIATWVALAFGWQVTSPPLAPGDIYRSANRDLVLHYAVAISPTHQLTLTANLQQATVSLPAGDAARRALGTAVIQIRPAYPAIFAATTDGRGHIALPGHETTFAQLGLVFPNLGSEESILVPELSAGLRVVQRGSDEGFVLELYRSDAVQPVYRAELTPGGQLTIPLGPDAPDLIVTAMPGLQVDVRHLPGLPIVPVGILLALFGTLAYFRRSAFVVVQIAPWSGDHSLVTIQSDHAETVERVQRMVEELVPSREAAEQDVATRPSTSLEMT